MGEVSRVAHMVLNGENQSCEHPTGSSPRRGDPMVRIQRKALGVVVGSFKGKSGPWEPAPFLEREALPQVRAINVLILVLALRQA